MTETPTRPPTEADRRAAFAALVAAQDEGASLCQSRAMVARVYGVAPEDLPALEQEGLDRGWLPPARGRR